jgi:hypothetical protein
VIKKNPTTISKAPPMLMLKILKWLPKLISRVKSTLRKRDENELTVG